MYGGTDSSAIFQADWTTSALPMLARPTQFKNSGKFYFAPTIDQQKVLRGEAMPSRTAQVTIGYRKNGVEGAALVKINISDFVKDAFGTVTELGYSHSGPDAVT